MSHLKKWVTLREIGHTCENGLQLQKYVSTAKMGQDGKKLVTLKVLALYFATWFPLWKMSVTSKCKELLGFRKCWLHFLKK